ncbi:hypothetical protein O1R50_22755 [Glycomyces luteolus]|uniref:Uncharacterized protein n=1 Tax=Glycomyces luteolus TaxID=2670330 RepID=A0A9X3PEC5_9ACTN|nr:hypothetical protein [Glycomyces luteolus]MDA1362461.1 hypothetical protein [Glycomyces luteolus]
MSRRTPHTTENPLRDSMLPVRVNRYRMVGAAVVAFGVALALGMLIPAFDPTYLSGFLRGAVVGGTAGYGCVAIARIVRGHVLLFDKETRQIQSIGRARDWLTYPRPGFDRIEYSDVDARIYEVRKDGTHRRLPIRRWTAKRQDGDVLVDILRANDPSRGRDESRVV